MATEERCKKHDLLPGQCAECLGHASIEEQVAAERVELLHQPGWFPAKFGGTCRLCGEPFTPDTAIRRQADSQGYVAECCAMATPETAGRRPAAVGLGPQPTHSCPCGCGRDVARGLFACRAGWYRLPYVLRRAIHATYNRDAAAHLEAMAAADEWYREHAGVRT
jgi:hypothetical protein